MKLIVGNRDIMTLLCDICKKPIQEDGVFTQCSILGNAKAFHNVCLKEVA